MHMSYIWSIRVKEQIKDSELKQKGLQMVIPNSAKTNGASFPEPKLRGFYNQAGWILALISLTKQKKINHVTSRKSLSRE